MTEHEPMIRLRAMTSADLATVLSIEGEVFPHDAWSEQMFREELANQPETRHYVVAEYAGQILGYAGLSSLSGQADVQTIAVLPSHQRWGIGSALLTELLTEAGRRGAQAVFLEVRADNERAQRLYRRFGFTEMGVRRGYYNGADALCMCLAMEPSHG